MSRFSDCPDAVVPGTTPVRSLGRLWAILGVTDQPADIQRAALTHWLGRNTPDAVLAWEIRDCGWGDLLPVAVA